MACTTETEDSSKTKAEAKQESGAQPLPALEVTALTIAPESIPFVKTFVAQTESSRAVDIVARVSGFLDRIAYAEGQLVQEGQVLFQLDQKPFSPSLTPPAASSSSSRRDPGRHGQAISG